MVLWGIIRWVAWNSFLALIPVALAYLLAWLGSMARGRALVKFAIVMVGLVWLAFLPNTCYLLTEWRHFLSAIHRESLYTEWSSERDHDAMISLIAYSLFFLAYSMFGMLTFALAIRPVVPLVKRRISRLWVIGIPFFALVSLGVYLGLVLRYNSWDLLNRPDEVWTSVVEATLQPFQLALILIFGAFLWVGYWIFDVWIDGFVQRLRRRATSVEPSACRRPGHPDMLDG